MEYMIEIKLPSELLNQVGTATKNLNQSANEYLQAALREKIDRWIRNEKNEAENCRQIDCVTGIAKMPDELLSQAERAATDFGLSVDDFLHRALQEKVNRFPQDIARKEEFDRITEHIFETRGELFRRLAQWPTKESASQ